MKNIQLFGFLTLAFFIFSFVACGNEKQSGAAETGAAKTETSKTMGDADAIPTDAAGADSQSDQVHPSFLAAEKEQYTRILQGGWRETASPDFTIEISGNKIKYFRSGNLLNESTFEIDTRCKETACEGGLGWCFIEQKEGKTLCNNIRRVDQKNLQYKILGPESYDKIYTKIER